MLRTRLFHKTVIASTIACAFGGAVAENAVELGTVEVSAAVESPYATKEGFAGTKTHTPLIETPMSVQVVPREVIDDQQALSLKDSLRNTSGVVSNAYSYYDFIQIRGFENGYAANYRNGLQLQAITGLEMALLDRVEVVKGPSSMLYGRVEPGGFVNMVTKKPESERAFSFQQQIGSYGLRKSTIDATGKITEDGTLLYRAIGAWTQADSFMDHVHKENKVGALYLTWRPNQRFELNVGFEAQNNRFVDTEDIGIPIIGSRPANVSRKSFYGDTLGWDIPNKANRTLYAFDWTYALNDQWKLTQRFHYDQRDEQQFTIWNNGFDSGTGMLDRGLWYVQPDRKTIATNIDLVGDVVLGGMRHRLLAGIDYFRFTSQWHGFSGTDPAITPINIWNPTYGLNAAAIRSLAENFFYDTVDEWHGFYLQDQISLNDRWELLLSGRYDMAKYGNGYSATSLSDASANLKPTTDSAFSPRIGLLYKLTPNQSIYGSYTESFGANNARSVSGGKFEPEHAKQVELGAKSTLFNGRGSASVTLFQLEKSNMLTPDLATPDPSDNTTLGQVRNRGIEFDLGGQVTENISLIGSYTYNRSKITQDNAGNQGNELPNVANHVANLWAKYDFTPGSRTGWETGGGIYYVGERQGDKANSWQLPAYTRVDAMLAYRSKIIGEKLTFQLNVQNLFDKVYFDRGNGGTGAKYGAPRTFIGSVKIDF